MILGIECTAHTFGVAVVQKRKILSNVRDMYKPKHGGIVPMDSARHHEEVAEEIYGRAIKEAKISENEIEAIALSNAPGLAPCLLAGMRFVKRKAQELNVPVIPVNHCIAHLEIGRSVGSKDPVLLYASGANTQIIAYSAGKYRVFGETLDSGIGNFIDTFARHAGIAFPGGPEIEKLAEKYKSKYEIINNKLESLEDDNKNKVKINKSAQKLRDNFPALIELPYSIKGMDVSFSGMQTKLKQLYDKGEKIEKLSYSMQEYAFAMLVEAAERALAHTGKNELVLGGGVACNKRLQEMCKIMCKERGAKYYCPDRSLLVDNAGMIGFTGELIFKKLSASQNYKINNKSGSVVGSRYERVDKGGNKSKKGKVRDNPNKIIFYPSELDKLDIAPRERTDQVDVVWR